MLSRSIRAAFHGGRMAATIKFLRTAFTLFLFTLLLLSLSAWAQSTAGRILGTVSDQSGAAVPRAQVVVTDTQRGTSRALTTDDSGGYVAPELHPGAYKIRVEAKGLKCTERPNVLIALATDVRAEPALQPGQVSEMVVVEEDV